MIATRCSARFLQLLCLAVLHWSSSNKRNETGIVLVVIVMPNSSLYTNDTCMVLIVSALLEWFSTALRWVRWGKLRRGMVRCCCSFVFSFGFVHRRPCILSARTSDTTQIVNSVIASSISHTISHSFYRVYSLFLRSKAQYKSRFFKQCWTALVQILVPFFSLVSSLHNLQSPFLLDRFSTTQVSFRFASCE